MTTTSQSVLNRELAATATRSKGSGQHSGQRKPDRDQWAEIWFSKLCKFHSVSSDPRWNFTANEVIAFLRSHLKRNAPSWKRLKIAEALLRFRGLHPVDDGADLTFIVRKLETLARAEKFDSANVNVSAAVEPPTEKEIVGEINPREPEVIQQMRIKLRLTGKAWNTERAYVKWLKRFMKSRGVVTLEQCQSVQRRDVEAFLTDLVVDGNVAPATQDQAFFAISFFFQHVLEKEIGNVEALRSSKPKLRPTVMSQDEVARVLEQLPGTYRVIASLLYGSGLRVSEALRLRIKDFDFDQRTIVVQCSKGKKSRLVQMPESLVVRLKDLIASRRVLHQHDVDRKMASVWLPYSLDRKFPNAHTEFRWQFLFASARHSKNPKTGCLHRHHLHRDSFTAALRKAVQRADILKYITSHTFRHSFATHLLMAGTDIRSIQELLGHADVNTTMIYTHVLIEGRESVKSPLDQLVAA